MKNENGATSKPHVIKVEPGKYAWCACGLSDKQPYCDGSHKTTEYKPVIKVINEPKTVAWCGCKQTAGAPFCDGTHKKL
ncbi:MAG: CDGSH iron-sulfur domain-containing protein [Balneolales bacterium]